MNDSKSLHFASLCVKDRYVEPKVKPHALPIMATSSFEFDSAVESIDAFQDPLASHVYSRYGNPTVEATADKLALLEGHGLEESPSAILCSTGMAAISTLFASILQQGDTVLTQGSIYGGTTELINKVFDRFGIIGKFQDLRNETLLRQSLDENKSIKLIYVETPSNPSLQCVDLNMISTIAKEYGIKTAIDNTFSTPYLQRPFEFGIDYIVHSTTKYLNGHGNSLSGAILCKTESEMKERFWPTMKLLGTSCSAFDAWMLNTGMRTLAIRMERHCDNAESLAEYLLHHEKILQVNYPGLINHESHSIAKKQMKRYGGMLSFELKGGLEAGKVLMSSLRMFSIAPTLGDVDTLVLHPASSSHLKVDRQVRLANGITDGLVRCSVGIEDQKDILGDFEQALAQV